MPTIADSWAKVAAAPDESVALLKEGVLKDSGIPSLIQRAPGFDALTPDELKAKLEGAWADVTHVDYFPASNGGVQLSTDRFIEVY